MTVNCSEETYWLETPTSTSNAITTTSTDTYGTNSSQATTDIVYINSSQITTERGYTNSSQITGIGYTNSSHTTTEIGYSNTAQTTDSVTEYTSNNDHSSEEENSSVSWSTPLSIQTDTSPTSNQHKTTYYITTDVTATDVSTTETLALGKLFTRVNLLRILHH